MSQRLPEILNWSIPIGYKIFNPIISCRFFSSSHLAHFICSQLLVLLCHYFLQLDLLFISYNSQLWHNHTSVSLVIFLIHMTTIFNTQDYILRPVWSLVNGFCWWKGKTKQVPGNSKEEWKTAAFAYLIFLLESMGQCF